MENTNMLGKIVMKLGEISDDMSRMIFDLLAKLCGEGGRKRNDALKIFLRMPPDKLLEVLTSPICCLEKLATTFSVDESDKRFFGKDFFSEKNMIRGVSCGGTGFFSGKIEENVPAAVLHFSKLLETSRSDRILKALRMSEENAKITLGQFAALLQAKLCRDGKGYIVYIDDSEGVLRVVGFSWGRNRAGKRGWFLDIDIVEHQDVWGIGSVVVSS